MNQFVITLILLLACGVCRAEDSSRSTKPEAQSLPAHGQRVVFLGDSITFDGRYTHYFEAYFLTHHPDSDVDFINVGLPSEGVTGLSEPAHPFPRPNVHERLGRVLQTLKPHVVFACYGMNDGIYYPLSEERFAAYRKGIDKLIAEATATGAKIILITPPPFDPLPVRKVLRDPTASEFSWVNPCRDYDKVLEKYSQWLLGLNDPRVAAVVDARTPTIEHLARMREKDPNYTLAPDGVHCNAVGQRLIAEAIVGRLYGQSLADLGDDADPKTAELLRIVGQRQALIGRAWMTHIGHKRPQTPIGEPIEQAVPKAQQLHRRARELVTPDGGRTVNGD